MNWKPPQLAASSSMQLSGAHFEIKVDGVVRSHRDMRESAIAARFLKRRNLSASIAITDLRDGSVVPHNRSA